VPSPVKYFLDILNSMQKDAYHVSRESIIHPQTFFIEGTVSCESSEADPKGLVSFFV
jgi:hypothetical protein